MAQLIMFTGLPGTGKTSTAVKLSEELNNLKIPHVHLDGDVMRQCWKDLGYSLDDRLENIDRIRRVAQLFYDEGLTVIVSVVAPSKVSRANFRGTFSNYTEIFLNEIFTKRPDNFYVNYEESDVIELTGIDSANMFIEQYESLVKAGIY